MKTCQQCGTEMPDDAPEGLCPRCLISAAAKPGDISSDPTRIMPESGAAENVGAASGMQLPDIGDAAEVARRLPQFEILALLGRGGMGVVYKARQPQLDRLVALKILPPAEALTADFVERFRREARSLAKLSHPNIVTVYEFGESGGLYYFVMELVDGVNLREMIRTGKMRPEEALAIVPKICDALQFAHEEGVMHRDIKPENILIDKRGRVKIADFGLAKLLRREQADHTLTMTGMTLGTPRYMAPEQLDKPESVDHRADIYSLGVVFYEMLTGEVPMGRFAPPSEKVRIDVRLDEIVLHALERDADRRYQHVSQVRDDVEKVTSKPQVAPVPPSTPPVPAAKAEGGREMSGGGDIKAGAENVTGPLRTFLRLMLWFVVIAGSVIFCWFDRTTYLDKTFPVRSELRIGAIEPWLFFIDKGFDSFGRANKGVTLDFATWSAFDGLCALLAGAALFSTRRRGARVAPPSLAPQEFRTKINAAGVFMLVAGIALLLGGFISFAVGASWDVWQRDKYAALGLAGAGTLHFLAGIAAISGGIFMRRMCFPGFAFAAAWMLCVLPFTAFLTQITLLKFAAVPLAFALYAGIRTIRVLFKPETKATFAAVRLDSSDEADASRARALSLAVGVTGTIAACIALFWGFSATGMGPGLPWRFDILVWLPGAAAAFGAAILLIQSSSYGRAAAADAIPEMTLAALGMGVGALPWRGLDHAMPNPWDNLVGSAWESGHGALFSLTYLVLGLFLLVTGGSKARPAWRAAVTLLAGVTALVIALHFATSTPRPPPDGFWHMPNGTLVTTLTFQLCFLGSFAIALLTVVVGAMQLRNHASESDASAAAPDATPALSPSELAGKTKAAGNIMLIAGIAIAVSGLIGFIYGAVMSFHYASTVHNPNDYVATRAMGGAFGMLALTLCGIAILNGGIAMRRLRLHGFAFSMSLVLMSLLPAMVIVTHGPPPQVLLLQVAFGLYAGIRAFRLLRKPEVEAAFAAAVPAPVSESSSEPRLSRLALWGAILAAQGFLIVPPAVFLYLKYHMPASWEFVLLGLSALSAIGAVFGTTICGAIAIAQIKRSDGKLYGLRLAATDALFFPLLLVSAVTFYITNLIAAAIAFNLRPQVPGEAGVGVVTFAVLDALVALIVCFFAGRKAWRAIVGQPAAPAKEIKPAVENNEPRLSRLALWGTIWAPFTAMGWWSWQMCVRQYFDNPAQFATYDPFFRTLGISTFIVAATAGLGSTLLGGIAVAQIKRSAGKLYGLPLAAIALLIHPLAALGVGAFELFHLAYRAVTAKWLWLPATQEHPPSYAYFHFYDAFQVLGFVASLLVCFFAGRAAWWKIVGQPAAPR